MLRHILALLLAAAPLAAQNIDKNPEHSAAYHALRAIQIRSIEESREFCGFIGYDETGRVRATPPTVGAHASCRIKDAPSSWRIVASYHTHGGWTTTYDDEVPSPQDMRSDMGSETNGYIATPGGRIWFFDHVRATAIQMCGLGCLPQDPRFTMRGTQAVPEQLTYWQLLDRFGEE
ncbi:DUF4329 domain-containing protein [Roseobacter sp. HKCCA0434]|uniref:DUF4329 domain-containing protein n=1 Tax=Roseobacter sp. HKCCA0434 TaxID=3079297 RepID=UPI002905E73E|nr:DUF4329 domain-containing protein [Roseobacter sp. HKCCA0434]